MSVHIGSPARTALTASVAICAYTTLRWRSLGDAVASVLSQLDPGDECLLVIDHNDELLALAEAEFAGQPVIRVLASQGPRGLSGARNTAIEASTGDLIAFLDDDATAAQGWLKRMRDCLTDGSVLGVGTAALPGWPGGHRPGWFPPEYDWVVGCSYLGLPETPADVRNVIGATMAFRREVFTIAGTFSSAVGRVGTLPTGCEETELCIRLRQACPTARISYLPDIAVTHQVGAQRLTVSYFLRRCFGEGVSKARVSRLVGTEAALESERRYLRTVLPAGLRRELTRGLRGQRHGWLAAFLIVAGVLMAGCGYVRATLTGRGQRDHG